MGKKNRNKNKAQVASSAPTVLEELLKEAQTVEAPPKKELEV